MATKTAKAETIPRGLQLATLLAIGGSFAMQWVLTLSTVLQQLQHNSNLSSYYMFFIGSVVVPIVYFTAAYFINPRSIPLITKLFESLLIMLVGQTIVQMAVQFAYMLQAAFAPQNPDQAFLNFIMYDAIAVTVTSAVYIAVLVWLRKTKRWK